MTPSEVAARSHMTATAADFVEALRRQARAMPSATAFLFLNDGEAGESRLTYEQLDRRARAIAARLQQSDSPCSRVLLAFRPGLEFIEGLFGCFYAGCVAVPTNIGHRRRRLDRFGAIVADADVSIALSTSSSMKQLSGKAIGGRHDRTSAIGIEGLPWIATDSINDHEADGWTKFSSNPDALAMLQYTSGSTSAPKGVMLSHRNLMHNARAIHEAFGVTSSDTAVSWLPTYHDMGLVGGVLEPVLGGITNVLLSPTAFLHNPFAWLDAISRYRATISGGPNFAYDLCVRKIPPEQRALLDLSSWSLAFAGAEPVHAETLQRFGEAFESCGFNADALHACYGLAEATLMVSGTKRGRGMRSIEVAPDAAHGGRPRRLVSCGRPVGQTQVKIVDPKSKMECPIGVAGELWVSGPSVGKGYWRKPKLTSRTFNATLCGDRACEEAFLRTGDMGMIDDRGELFITGRRDDLIIIRGLNRYPHDIESTARASHPQLEGSSGAAFCVSGQEHEKLVLVHEVTRNGTRDYTHVIDAASAAVLEEHELALDAVVLVRRGTIPRTSSGKIQRFACRNALLADELHVVAQRSVHPQSAVLTEDDTADSAIAAIRRQVKAIGNGSNAEITSSTRLNELGLDSMQRVELIAALERAHGRKLPDTCDAQTVGELAHVVERHLISARSHHQSGHELLSENDDVRQFPEYITMDRDVQALNAVTDGKLYFQIDPGRNGHVQQQCINFCRYDYLAMAREPRVIAEACAAIERYGTGAGASRLVSGELQVHRDLEHAISSFLGTPDACVFVSGHATNVTLIGHLFGPGDLILYDRLAHNSIIQGAQLSGAEHRAFAHNDWRALDRLLSEARHGYRRVLIAIEGVYSMDGDWPDLPRFVDVKRAHRCMLLVDEAHSLGTMGETGRGIAEHCGVNRNDVEIWMGTLSKALASCGGYIAGSNELIKYLKYTAPGFVYSVGMSPANAAAALAAVKLLDREPHRVRTLRKLSTEFLQAARAQGIDTGLAHETPVVPVLVGRSTDALSVALALQAQGIHAQPIMHPAVAENAARLRFFITINHSREDIHFTIEKLAEAMKRIGSDVSPARCVEPR